MSRWTLVTGATGLLGPVLVERLAAAGHQVRALARPGSDARRLHAAAHRHPGSVEVVTGGLGSVAAIDDLMADVALVHHLAAGTRGHPADIWASSVVATARLVEAMARQRQVPRLVLTSSVAVYAAALQRAGAVVDEDTPLEPSPQQRDPYTMGKVGQEQVAWQAHRAGRVALTVVRPGVMVAPGAVGLPARVGLHLAGGFLFLGGDNPLPLIDPEDCAHALVSVGDRPELAGHAFNAVTDATPTCRQYLARYRRDVGPLRTVPVPRPALRAMAGGLARYHRWSNGQLPALLTPYRVAASWTPLHYANARLKATGWTPAHPGPAVLDRAVSAGSGPAR